MPLILIMMLNTLIALTHSHVTLFLEIPHITMTVLDTSKCNIQCTHNHGITPTFLLQLLQTFFEEFGMMI
jgi:hypothetical protein